MQGKFKEPQTVLEWAERYRRPDGQPFSLDRYEPLRAIYEDDHPRIVIMKPAQRGVSEYAVNLACFALEYGARRWTHGRPKAGLNVGYIFPVRGALMEFSKERVSSLKDESSHLANLFGGDEFDALGFKQVGESYFYLRGGTSTSDLLSFAADVMILDEYDRLAKKAVALARRRMNASMVKREIDISTPTLPGHGISAAYLATDQRVYETMCRLCKEWNTYDFFRDVYLDGVPYEDSNEQSGWKAWSQEKGDLATVDLRCPACHRHISNEARCAPGRWRVTHPEYTRVHGYHIPWWAFPFIELPELVHSALSEEIEEIEELYRSDLGLPYGAGGGQVTEEMLRQLSVGMPATGLPRDGWRNNTLGADIGARVHYRVSGIGPDGIRYVREIGATDWDGLDRLMGRYQIRMAVVDAEPEYSLSDAFCNRWKGRALRAFYPSGPNALRGTLMNVKSGTHDLQVNRTMAMDTVYKTIADAKEVWPGFIVNSPEVIDHMSAPSRVRTEDSTGQPHYTWVHTRPDHLFHACVYDMMAERSLPKVSSFTPAVRGTRPMVAAYEHGGGRRSTLPPPSSRHGRLPVEAYERSPRHLEGL